MQKPELQPDDEALEFLELLEPEPTNVLQDATDTGMSIASELNRTGEHAVVPNADDEEYEFLELLEPDPIEELIASQPSEVNSGNEEYEFLELLEPESVITDKNNTQNTSPAKTGQATTPSIALEQNGKPEDLPAVIPLRNPPKKVWRWAGVAALCFIAGLIFLHVKDAKEREHAYIAAITEGQEKQGKSDFSGAVAAFFQALTIPGYEGNREAKRLLAESQDTKQRSDYFNTTMNEGHEKLGERNYTAAIMAFTKALSIPGYSNNAYAQQILQETENIAENVRNFTTAMDEGRRLYEAENYKDATSSFQKALKIPGHTQNTEAAQLLREAQGRELEANHFASTVNEGKRLYDMKQYDEAVVVFRQALSIPGHADDIDVRVLLREAEAIGENSKTFTTTLNEGIRLHEAEEYGTAIEAFQKALNVPGYAGSPEATQLLQEAQSEELAHKNFTDTINNGKRFYEANQYDNAATAFRQALNMPGYADNIEAKALLREAEVLGNNTKTFTSIMSEGMRLYQTKEYDNAAVVFRQALGVAGYESHEVATRLLNESNFASAFFEGTRQIEEKNYDAARISFQRALDMPGNEQHHEAVQQWLAHAIAASGMLKRQAEVERLAVEQANRNRDNFDAAVSDGRAKYEKKDFYGAAKAFETALSIPGYADHAQVKQWLAATRTAESRRQIAIQQAQERVEREQAEAVARASVVTQKSAPLTASPIPATVRMTTPRPQPISIQWFAIIDGEPSESLTPDSLRREISAGRMTRATPLWRDGMNEWTPAGELPEIAQFFPAMPSPAPTYTASSVESRPPPYSEEHDDEESEAAERDKINPEVKNVLKGLAGSVLNEVFKRVR